MTEPMDPARTPATGGFRDPATEPRRSSACVSDLTLDRVVTGEEARETIAQHLRTCERCEARLELFVEQAAVAEDTVARLLSAAETAAALQPTPAFEDARAAEGARGWLEGLRERWGLFGAAAASLAAVAFSVSLGGPLGDTQPPSTAAGDAARDPAGASAPLGPGARHPADDILRIKGTAVRVVRKRGDDVRGISDGAAVQAGDALRFLTTQGAPTELLVAALDENGTVQMWFPFDGERSQRVTAGVEQPLAGSVVLDGDGGDLWVLALFSKEPVERATVEAALSGLSSSVSRAALAERTLPGSAHWIRLSRPSGEAKEAQAR